MAEWNRNKDVSYMATSKIRDYWLQPHNAREYCVPDMKIDRTSFAISSNMVNGYPPPAKVRAR